MVKEKILAKYQIVVASRLSRYMEMFKFLPKSMSNDRILSRGMMKGYVRDVSRIFKREDRIMWILRKVRDGYKARLSDNVVKKDGSGETTEPIWEQRELETYWQDLVHFISQAETLGFNSVLEYRFPPKASVLEVYTTLRDLTTKEEDKAKEARNDSDRLIDRSDDVVELIKFPDGWVWDYLDVGSCEEEGRAMRHCGNTAAVKPGDRILSLREPVKVGKGKHTTIAWKPHATFIINDGILGEMKGFANEKPKKEHHKYIVELLKNPVVKWIGGGGYAPEKNFEIEDLEPAQQKELEREKPSLVMGYREYHRQFGLDDNIKALLRSKGVLRFEGDWAIVGEFPSLLTWAQARNSSITEALDYHVSLHTRLTAHDYDMFFLAVKKLDKAAYDYLLEEIYKSPAMKKYREKEPDVDHEERFKNRPHSFIYNLAENTGLLSKFAADLSNSFVRAEKQKRLERLHDELRSIMSDFPADEDYMVKVENLEKLPDSKVIDGIHTNRIIDEIYQQTPQRLARTLAGDFKLRFDHAAAWNKTTYEDKAQAFLDGNYHSWLQLSS